MRYVIVFVTIAAFIILDLLQNNGHYTNSALQALRQLFRSIGI